MSVGKKYVTKDDLEAFARKLLRRIVGASISGGGDSGSPGSGTFLELSDTPSSYDSEALKAVRVNAGASALEFHEQALGDLADVELDAPYNPEDGDVLTYSASLGLWIPALPPPGGGSGGGASVLDDLEDVDAPSPDDGDALAWDAGSSKWVSSPWVGPLMLKRFCKIVMTNATHYASGVMMTTAGTAITNDDDDASNFTKYRTGTSSGNAAGIYAAGENFTRGHHNPTFYCKFKTHSDITNQRFFIGFWAGASSWNNDSPVDAKLMCLRYVAGTANFTYITKDGVTLNSVDSGVAVNASTVYTIKIVVSSDGTAVTFSINGGAEQTLTTNLPTAATPLGFGAYILTKEAASKYLSVSQIYVEGD